MHFFDACDPALTLIFNINRAIFIYLIFTYIYRKSNTCILISIDWNFFNRLLILFIKAKIQGRLMRLLVVRCTNTANFTQIICLSFISLLAPFSPAVHAFAVWNFINFHARQKLKKNVSGVHIKLVNIRQCGGTEENITTFHRYKPAAIYHIT